MAQLLMGAPVAEAITASLSVRADRLKERGIQPVLAIVRVGDNTDDRAYESAAAKRCQRIGIQVKPFACSPEELLAIIDEINRDESIHGCLLLRPLADKELEAAACERLYPQKDADQPSCTAQACLEILDYYGVPLQNRSVCVIGRSAVVGKPVRELLEARGAEVTVCHSQTPDISAVCRRAEILVSAVGKAGLVTADCVVPGQIVVDVGINAAPNGKLCGDVDFPTVEPIVSAITPVPGGVGSVTTAVLCKHIIEAAEIR